MHSKRGCLLLWFAPGLLPIWICYPNNALQEAIRANHFLWMPFGAVSVCLKFRTASQNLLVKSLARSLSISDCNLLRPFLEESLPFLREVGHLGVVLKLVLRLQGVHPCALTLVTCPIVQ